MFGFRLLGNVNVPHRKNTAEMPAIPMTPPKEVLLPMSQHIGAPAVPLVKFGDTVKIGQKIADAGGFVSSPIYATISGKIGKTENYLRSDGRVVPAIRIIGDGLMEEYEQMSPPEVNDLDSLISAVRESGLVGLGGAGFPTSVKLGAVKNNQIDTVIFNGAECEPYITSDTRTMLDESQLIMEGVKIFEKFFPDNIRYIFGIEKNKPLCIERMNSIFESDEKVSTVALPTKYPQGGEKVLIYNITKRIVPEGKLPADVGVLVINVTSLAIIAKYVKTGIPLVRRCVTVDGSAVAQPKNVFVPIGTPVKDVIDFAGGLTCEPGKVLFGGPMMGTPCCTLDEPITKTTGAITVMNKYDSKLKEETACIHCGRCVEACPLDLNPTEFAKALTIHSKEERMAKLEQFKVNLCMECGCCSYVCPANRPLVQKNRLGKAELREYKAHQATLKK